MKIRFVCFILLSLSHITLWSGFLEEIPRYAVYDTRSKKHFLRIDHKESMIEVRSSADLSLQWKVKLQNFQPHFTEFYLSHDSEYLYRVYDNYLVSDLKSTCLEVIKKSGKIDSYKAGDFLTQLKPTGIPKEMAANQFLPQWSWHKNEILVEDKYIAILLSDGRRVYLSRSGKILFTPIEE